MSDAVNVALVIDDDPNIRLVTKILLERLGYVVLVASDGVEGLALFDHRRPGLVIVDLIMPRCEGIETIRALRRPGVRTTLIAMSGCGAARDFLRYAIELGADYAVAKPFGVNELSQAVMMASQAARMRHEAETTHADRPPK